MTVEPFTTAHLNAVCDLEQHLFDRPLTVAHLTSLAAGTAFRGWVITAPDPADPNPIYGYLLMHVVDDQAEILSIGTAPHHQRTGIAARLLTSAIVALRAAGLAHIFLEVAVDNPPALALYEGMAFTQVGRRRDYYHRGTGRCDALVLQHVL